MSHWRELDGFHLFSGVSAVVAGPIMLAMGAPAGWAFIVIVTGTLVLLAQWVLVSEIVFRAPDAMTIVLGVAGILFVGIAVVYLTRAADDLPTVFPGYDPNSENFRLIPGILALTVGAVAVARAIASVYPTRHVHH